MEVRGGREGEADPENYQYVKGVKMTKRTDRLFTMLTDVFTRPIIGNPTWADSITVEQKNRVQFERMKQLAESKGEKIDMVPDYEAMLYVMTASLSAPLSHTWVKIYCHLFKKFYPEKSDFIPDHDTKIEGDIIAERELIRLKRWLFKKSKQK